MRTIVVIPARLASKRLPRKPLADIKGKTMIQRVWEQVKKCKKVQEVYVATPDKEIAATVKAFGGKPILTKAKHKNGSEAVAQAAKNLKADVVINVQGDKPFTNPRALTKLVQVFNGNGTEFATILHPISIKEAANPSKPKAVLDTKGNVMFYSRNQIPFFHTHKTSLFQSGGIYAFTKKFLQEYARLPQGKIEKCESLEQMRVLEHGHKIKAVVYGKPSLGIDTAADLEKARRLLK